MTKKPNDGGPAFPVCLDETPKGFREDPDGYSVEVHHNDHPGMSLRDWFAGLGLAAVQAAAATMALQGGDAMDSTQVASVAYDVADAMIAERTKDSSP